MKKLRVGFFVSCLANSMRPSIALDAIKILEKLKFEVIPPKKQACCGQVGYNAGYQQQTIEVAKKLIDEFIEYDFLVAPTASCIEMIKFEYPKMLENDSEYSSKADLLAIKSFEFVDFLDKKTDFINDFQLNQFPYKNLAYHDSCSAFRKLNIKKYPYQLLANINNTTTISIEDKEVCCGFGGMFCIRFDTVASQMADDKIDQLVKHQVELLTGLDLGCLIHLANRIKKRKLNIKVLHLIEIVAKNFKQEGIDTIVL